jgi:hypothetical protein
MARSRGLGDVYKRQALATTINSTTNTVEFKQSSSGFFN